MSFKTLPCAAGVVTPSSPRCHCLCCWEHPAKAAKGAKSNGSSLTGEHIKKKKKDERLPVLGRMNWLDNHANLARGLLDAAGYSQHVNYLNENLHPPDSLPFTTCFFCIAVFALSLSQEKRSGTNSCACWSETNNSDKIWWVRTFLLCPVRDFATSPQKHSAKMVSSKQKQPFSPFASSPLPPSCYHWFFSFFLLYASVEN